MKKTFDLEADADNWPNVFNSLACRIVPTTLPILFVRPPSWKLGIVSLPAIKPDHGQPDSLWPVKKTWNEVVSVDLQNISRTQPSSTHEHRNKPLCTRGATIITVINIEILNDHFHLTFPPVNKNTSQEREKASEINTIILL